MKELKYDEIEECFETSFKKKVVFEEYDRNMSLLLKVEGFETHTYIKENEFLDRDQVLEYYGEDRETECYNPYIRLILTNPEDESDIIKYYPIHLNKAYMSSGYQKLWVEDV